MAQTNADKAYQKIREKIVNTEMPPGSPILEAELMDTLKLGRTPIREALKRLEGENLVSVTPRRGMFVSEIAFNDLLAIYEVRVELESLCAELASRRFQPEHLKKLEALAEELAGCDEEDLEMLFDIDHRFHRALAKAANNRFLSSDLERYYALSKRIWNLALANIQPRDIDVGAHLDIIRAVKKSDHNQAKRRMRKHIEIFHQAIRKHL